MKLIWIMFAVLLVAGCKEAPKPLSPFDVAVDSCERAFVAASRSPATVSIYPGAHANPTNGGYGVRVMATDENGLYSGNCYTDQDGQNPRVKLD